MWNASKQIKECYKMRAKSTTKCPPISIASASPFQSLDFSIELFMSREFIPVIVRGPSRLWEVEQLGIFRPELGSLAGTPAREPNGEGNADGGDEENLPRVEEPFEKPADNYDCMSISTVP